MKRHCLLLVAFALALWVSADADAQMISTQYAKKVILADGSASLVPLTLKAPASLTGGAYTLTLPATVPLGNGYLLSSNTSGDLSWVNPTSYNFLTGVSHNATLTGAGTSGSPLAIDLTNANSWSGTQTFATNTAQGNALIASINSANTTIDAIRIASSLSDLQVSDNLTINGGVINNTAIGGTTAASGRFTSLTNTSFGTAGIVHNNASGVFSSSLIVNADVDPAAAIVDTKLATISTAGKVLNSATTATSTNTNSAIVARDASGNFAAATATLTSINTPTTGPGTALSIQPGVSTSSTGGAITITGGQGGPSSGNGGNVTISGGDAVNSGSAGGVLTLQGGTGVGSANGNPAYFKGGNGGATGNGGSAVLQAGAPGATSGDGGTVTITATNATGTNKDGGDVNITVGDKSTGIGAQGQMTLTGGNFLMQTGGAQLSLKGTGTGVSTFQAGAQGTNTFNYTLPTTAATVGQMLTTTATSGSTPFATTLSWSNSPVISGGTIDNAPIGTTTASTGKFTTMALTTNSSGAPTANTVYKDNMINAWANIPAGGTTATASFGITSYTHAAVGTYVLTISNALATATHGAIQVTIGDASSTGALGIADAQWSSASTITVHTWTFTLGGNFNTTTITAADHRFYISVVQGQ